jgi:hypothetical protein
MGNFSRNTFDPRKGYVAVHLQQGVPLVDADVNELADIARNELYAGLRAGYARVAARDGGLAVTAGPGGDDVRVSAGSAVVGGFPIVVASTLRHNVQRYADPVVATTDGVAVVTPIPLAAPPGPRTDAVYLDVFEREVTSAEDGALINPAIGIETAVRVRREVVVRVALGALDAPPPAANHAHLLLATINRTAGPITNAQIVDAKPYAPTLGPRMLSFPPLVAPLPITNATARVPWTVLGNADVPPRIIARQLANTTAEGVLALALPDGALLTELRLRGRVTTGSATTFVKLARAPLDGSATATIAQDTVVTTALLDRTIRPAVPELVDNAANQYYIHLISTGTGALDLWGGAVRYVP